jgi:hypothetical protein
MVAKLHTTEHAHSKRKPKFSSPQPKFSRSVCNTFDTITYSHLSFLVFGYWKTPLKISSFSLSSSMGQNTVPFKSAFLAFHGLDSTYSFPLESASIFRADAFDLRSEGVIWLLAQGPS